VTKNSPAAAARWAVSTRMHGDVLTASVSLPSIELVLLGIPQGFTPVEIQSWLKDLAGVAIETSRADQRVRPIPQLLHHALTGLLFSQSELWSHTGHALPCAAVFVDGPQGTAFGWVGQARVMLLVNGEPHEPQWVIVRDEAGHEAMSAELAADAHVLMTLEYWPQGEDGTQAPVSVDAECGQAFAVLPGAAPAASEPAAAPGIPTPDEMPAPGVLSAWAGTPLPATPEPLGIPRPPLPPTPESLPMQQPGLAQHPAHPTLDRPDATQALPSTYHASAGTFSMPHLSTRGTAAASPGTPGEAAAPASAEETGAQAAEPPSPVWTPAGTEPGPYRTRAQSAVAAERSSGPPALGASGSRGEPSSEPGHPVGRWLSRMLGFARKPATSAPETSDAAAFDPASEPVAEAPTATYVEASPRSAPQPDISEPHALPASARESAPPASAPGPTQRGGLSAAGLQEIFGAKPSPARVVTRPMEGLTAVSAASGPVEPPPEMRVTPESASAGKPPYPMLDVKPPTGSGAAPIRIEREPVAADPTFGIPRLPQREAPKPVRVPAAAPTAGRAAGPPAQPTAPAAPAQGVVSPPRAGQPPVLVTPGSRPAASAPPEPPADFLAEFAASLNVEPVMDPTLPAWQTGTTAPTGAPLPPTLPPGMRGTPIPTRPTRAAPPATPVVAPPTIARPASPPAGAPAPVTRPVATPPRAASPPAPAAPPPRPAPQPPASSAPVAPPRVTPAPAAVPPPVEAPVLRAPVKGDPAHLAAVDVAALMRELSLPTPSAEMANPVFAGAERQAPDPDDIPDGMLLAHPASVMPPGARSRRAVWPAPDELDTRPTPLWRKPWAVGTFVAVLFGIGWLVGHSQAPDNDVHATPLSRLLRTVGLGGARFSLGVDSDPPGAWISVDGKDISRRTPSTLELIPGAHVVTLSIPDLGSVKVPVTGTRGQKLKVNEALQGSLDVSALDPSLPVKMSLDGEPQGFLPVHVAKLPPGLHEVQFSGPNMQPWGQNVSVGIRQTTEIVAKPMMSPATGVVQVQASLNDDNGTAPATGATVFVDGEIRGSTPLTIELPRGPHSLRVTFHGETAPVQVLDLPGGNQRFATFQFGLDSDLPPLKLQGNYAYMPARKGSTVTASLDNLDAKDVREAWLHVKTPDGLWRRYDMTVVPGPRGAMLSVVFPVELFDAQGRVTWYLSAATGQGDEFFTELQHSAH
jgi:hypothetical protein